jgi:hypothetical protein
MLGNGVHRQIFKGLGGAKRGIHPGRHFMQNRPMATSSDKSKTTLPPKAPTRTQDFSLDPLPVPEAIESDSDTAWGLWEHTLQALDAPDAASDAPSEMDTVYDETIAGDLTAPDGKKV